MTEKYAAANDYTDAELLALYRECLARISVSGQSYQMTLGGGTRNFTAADLKQVREMVTWLEDKISRVSAGSTVNYANLTRG
jgi:hypothetical protein